MENKKLIVLGNGFDLACGLKSRYADFFNKRINDDIYRSLQNAHRTLIRENKSGSTGLNAPVYMFPTLFDIKKNHSRKNPNYDKIEEFKNLEIILEDRNTIENSGLTFWDIVLFYFQNVSQLNLEDVQWQNIEDRMLDFLTSENTETPSLKDIYRAINGGSGMGFLNWVCLFAASFLPNRKKSYLMEDFFQYLYDELRLFETAFVEYLDNEVKNSDNYKTTAVNLLEAITSENIQNLSKHSVLSFNYTKPLKKHIIHINNVHGTLESKNIIFGIDKTGVKTIENIYRFTKTFRQMTETNISKDNGDEILPRGNVSEIAFFGHSLSKLDYSYFQTLFDFYDLYSSNIKLAFYYKVYSGTSSLDMELDLSTRISKLIEAYGESIENEKKSDNLMHKLLLEKRLIIEEISC